MFNRNTNPRQFGALTDVSLDLGPSPVAAPSAAPAAEEDAHEAPFAGGHLRIPKSEATVDTWSKSISGLGRFISQSEKTNLPGYAIIGNQEDTKLPKPFSTFEMLDEQAENGRHAERNPKTFMLAEGSQPHADTDFAYEEELPEGGRERHRERLKSDEVGERIRRFQDETWRKR